MNALELAHGYPFVVRYSSHGRIYAIAFVSLSRAEAFAAKYDATVEEKAS